MGGRWDRVVDVGGWLSSTNQGYLPDLAINHNTITQWRRRLWAVIHSSALLRIFLSSLSALGLACKYVCVSQAQKSAINKASLTINYCIVCAKRNCISAPILCSNKVDFISCAFYNGFPTSSYIYDTIGLHLSKLRPSDCYGCVMLSF